MAEHQIINVQRAIKTLDEVSETKGLQYTLYTCGGAALIFLGYEGRGTGDIDVILDRIDSELQGAINQVAKKLKIPEDWLNNKVTPLGKRLGKNWKKKCVTLFQGKAITLMSISRQDLISSKLHAAVDRQSIDFGDLIWMNPSKQEIETARTYAIKQGTSETYEVFVNAYVRRLYEELKIK